ncbi:MAG: hypothetical protein PHQ71_06555 [Candidatus Hydrothermia bacterium]|jgi:hypothetical protein|nr:hypothetical protein [Candidatus Hydrothermia bacterium]MDD5573417.1 hypothetical protein [Candidatus Hydrothermia bacterium]
MEPANKNKALFIALLLLSAASTVIYPPSFPDLSVVFVIYLSLKYESLDTIIWLLVAGLLHDGFQPNVVWISPILFPLIFLGMNFVKENFNIKYFGVKLLSCILALIISFSAYAVFLSITPLELLSKGLWTLALSVVVTLIP